MICSKLSYYKWFKDVFSYVFKGHEICDFALITSKAQFSVVKCCKSMSELGFKAATTITAIYVGI